MVQWHSSQPMVTSKGVEISFKQQGVVCFMPPFINFPRASAPLILKGQPQLYHQRLFGLEPQANPQQESTPVNSCPVEPKFHRLNQWLQYSPEVSAIVATKFFGGHVLDVLRSQTNAALFCSSKKVNIRQLVRSSMTSAGLAANTMRSIFSIAGPHALHGKVASATDSPLLAGMSSVGAATLNATFLETAFVTRTPAYASLRYAHVLKTSALPLAGCYFLREAPYMIALLGLPDDMSLSKKLLVTACLAGASFFPDAASRGIFDSRLRYPERTGVWDQFKQPFNQLLSDTKINGGNHLLPAIGIRMATITANVALYKAIFQWIKSPSN